MQSFITCKHCLLSLPHHAHGYCTNCYHKFMVRKTGAFNRNDAELYQKHLAQIKEKISQTQRQRQRGAVISDLTREKLKELYCNQGMSMGDIAGQFKCSRVYVMLLLRKYDLPIRNKSAARAEAKRKGKNVGFSAINENFFKSPSPEMAYVLGFIYSDGNINNQQTGFSISQKEPEILQKIKDLMSSEHKIPRQKKQELYTLTVGNRIMVKDLLALGLTPNKSLDVNFPVLPPHLYSHFIRGFFDGDGCVGFFSKHWQVGFVSGSEAFINKLRDRLMLSVEVSYQKIYPAVSGRAFNLKYFRNSDLIKIFNLFYDDAALQKRLYLERKYQAFLQCFGQTGRNYIEIVARDKTSLGLVIDFLNRYVCLVSGSLRENAITAREVLINLKNTMGEGAD